ncbi:MAG: hypothetical protein ACOZNI_22385 [Myxococcota bacterium]
MLILLLLLLVACVPPGPAEGTAVGNLTVSVDAASGTGVTFTSGEATLARVDLEGCAEATDTVTFGREVDLLGGERLALPIEGGWCALGFAFDGPLVLSGGGNGGTFTLSLEVPELRMTGEVSVGGKVLELAAPGWVDVALLGLSEGTDVRVDAGSELHALLVDAITDDSAMFADEDESGHVDEGERARGAEAACGADMDAEMDDTN